MQTADLVLQQEGQEAGVRVRPNADLLDRGRRVGRELELPVRAA